MVGRILQTSAALLLGTIATLSAASCKDAQIEALVAALGEGCLIDSDCNDDLICVFRRCHVECDTTKDCRDRGEDTDCVLGDSTKICLLPVEDKCVVDEVEAGEGVVVALYLHATCPSGQFLCARDGECRNRCTSDANCLFGAKCTVTGVCAEPEDADDAGNAINEAGEHGVETATCIYSSECIAPLICRDNLCRQACLADVDCSQGQQCMLVESPALNKSFGACRFVDDDPTVPASCTNGMLDEDESAVDCGGSLCAPCASGATCNGPSDCQSGICNDGGICQVPSCNDGIANANETDVDCGGPQCTPCGAGAGCFSEVDCGVALACDPSTLTCTAATCSDGTKNGDESDVDCGGSCSTACADGASCTQAGECQSGVCVSSLCQSPTCADGVVNSSETGPDCGGAGCAPCGAGAACAQASDCQSGSCQANVCSAPSCSDGMQNGFELGVDCGGPDCALLSQGCALGTTCNVDGDCDQSSPAGCALSTMQCTAKHTVTVSVVGAGTGYVLSSPVGMNCHSVSPSLCQMSLYVGESLTLIGYPVAGSTFAGLSGGCVGNPSCNVTVTSDQTVTATFQ
jgi:hypothetical protein